MSGTKNALTGTSSLYADHTFFFNKFHYNLSTCEVLVICSTSILTWTNQPHGDISVITAFKPGEQGYIKILDMFKYRGNFLFTWKQSQMLFLLWFYIRSWLLSIGHPLNLVTGQLLKANNTSIRPWSLL